MARTQHLTHFISAQNRYNMLDRQVEAELLPACQRHGLGMLPYSPLANGFLTGKYRPGEGAPAGTRLAAGGRNAERVLTEGNFATLRRLEEFTADREKTVLDLAIGWLASQPTVGSVIAGATNPEQVDANVRAGEWELTAEDLARVSGVLDAAGPA